MIASEGGQAPLHERVEEMLRKKEVHLHTIRVRVEGEQAATFAPSINPISSAIAAAVYSEKASSMPLDCGGRLGHTASGTAFSTAAPDVVERLSAEASLVLERRAQRELQRREAEVQQCPFKPQVNGLSDRIADQVNASGGGHKGTVFTRLQEKAKEAEARKKQREAQALEEESATFKSTASEANGILLAARSARLNESHLERTERLAYVDSKRKEAIKQQLQAAHYSQFTHTPHIDSISSRLARSKTDAELSANAQGKALRESLAKKREKTEAAACTFKPQLDRRSQQIAASTGSRSALGPESVGHLSERLAHEHKEREAKLERARREVEAATLKECTFVPQLSHAGSGAGDCVTSSGVSGSKDSMKGGNEGKPLVIHGLGRYMELKQMAKRQADAQKQREQKAFLIEPPARLHPYTVTEPFSFSVPKETDERSERVRLEVERARVEECTFEPKTNEASVEVLLARVGSSGGERAGHARKSEGYARK